jgi:hypothetical protein
MSTVRNDRVPAWGKYAIATIVGAGAVTGGYKLSTDSPVHLLTEGKPPEQADGWVCLPEGGLIGAPVVCRPKTDAQVGDSAKAGHDDSVSTSRATGTSQEQ